MVPLTPLTSKNYTSPIFFLVFHRWHCWRLKKYEEKYFKRGTGLIADGVVDTVDIKKLIHQPIFSPLFGWWLHWCLWHLKKLQRSIELKHILSFLLINTVQILIWMFSALRYQIPMLWLDTVDMLTFCLRNYVCGFFFPAGHEAIAQHWAIGKYIRESFGVIW